MHAALRTALTTLLVALACALATPPPAGAAAAPAAAECGPLDLGNPTAVLERAGSATDVFAGKVVEAEPRGATGGDDGSAGGADQGAEQGGDQGADGGNDQPSDGPTRTPDPRTTRWQHTVTVVSPFRSALRPGDQALVVTQPAGRAEGLGRLDRGATYVFFVSGQDGVRHLLAGRCSGTQKLSGGLTAEMQRQLEETLRPPADPEEAPELTLVAPEGGAPSDPSLGRLAAPGAALALIGLLGLLLVARTASRRG